MSNIKFHTNRQVALQMAMEEAKRTVGSTGGTKFVLEIADKMYEWLQNAPMKDEDKKHWIVDPVIRTKDKK
jgi:dsDNA-binding SOS-regulon protein